MKILELIEKLEFIRSKYGNCDVVVDVPERGSFCFDFKVSDKWNQFPDINLNNCFITLSEE